MMMMMIILSLQDKLVPFSKTKDAVHPISKKKKKKKKTILD